MSRAAERLLIELAIDMAAAPDADPAASVGVCRAYLDEHYPSDRADVRTTEASRCVVAAGLLVSYGASSLPQRREASQKFWREPLATANKLFCTINGPGSTLSLPTLATNRARSERSQTQRWPAEKETAAQACSEQSPHADAARAMRSYHAPRRPAPTAHGALRSYGHGRRRVRRRQVHRGES